MNSKSLIIRESGTQLIPWDHISCGLSVQTIGSRFAPKNYLKLCESIDFPKLSKQLKQDKNIDKNLMIEDIYKLSDQQIILAKDLLESRENLKNFELILNIEDKQLPEYKTHLTEEEFTFKFIDHKLLTYDNTEKIIDEILEQMKNEYMISIKVSIYDYILNGENLFKQAKLIENNQKSLNMKNRFNCAKQRNFSFNFTFDPTVQQIVKIWNKKYRNINIYEFDFLEVLDINEFKSIICQNCQKLNFKLRYEWISDCNQILLNICSKFIKYDGIKNKKFFDSIASIMSLLVRELIIKNLRIWINILSNNFDKMSLFKIFIKCKPSGDPYFVPPVDKWREILLYPLICLLECNKDIDRVENNLILFENKKLTKKFLFRIKIFDSDIQNYQGQILSFLNRIDFNKITENYRKEFTDKFSNDINIIEIHKHDPGYIVNIFEASRKSIIDLIISKNEMNVGIFKINFHDYKTYVKNWIEDQIKNVISNQLINVISLAKQVCHKFKIIEKTLEMPSETCYKLIKNLRQLKMIKSDINLIIFDIQYIEKNWNSLVESGTKLSIISEPDFEVMHRIYYWPQRIQLCFNDREKRLELEKLEIQKNLESKVLFFENEIKNLRNILEIFETKKVSSPFESIFINCEQLNDINNSLRNLLDEYQEINSRQQLLKFNKTDFPLITQLIERTTVLENIWKTASLYQNINNRCMSQSIRSLDLKDIRQTIDKLLSSCDQMNINLNPGHKSDDLLQNVDYLETNIQRFKVNYIPLMEVFSNSVLRERHLHKINEIIGQNISWTVNPTLSEVMSIRNPMIYINQITSLCEIARKEYELELLLEKMKNEWVDEWPTDALEIVANKFLEEESLSYEVRHKCSKAFKLIHLDSMNFVKVINEQNKDQSTSRLSATPFMFIELIVTFKRLLKQKKKQLNSKKNIYLERIERLDSVTKSLKTMKSQMINDFQPIILNSSIETENLMIRIEKETLKVEIHNEVIATDEAMVNQSAACAQQIKDDCYNELTRAVPAIKSAIKGINTLKSDDITLLRSMKCPPLAVRTVLEAVCILIGIKPEKKFDRNTNRMTDDYWSSSLKMMSDVRFLEKLKNFDRNGIQRNFIDLIRQKYLHSEHFEPTALKRVSKACEGLAKWVRGIDIYDRLINVIKPKTEKLKATQTELKKVLQIMEYKKIELNKTIDCLQQLNDQFSAMSKKKRQIDSNREKCRSKLIWIQKLIDELKSRKINWIQISSVEEQTHQIVAELMLSASFFIYACALTPEQRNSLLNKWQNYLENECDFSFSKKFNFIETLGDSFEILKWIEKGMATQQFDIENAIISQSSRRLPLIINSNNVIKEWLNRLYPDLIRIDMEFENEDNFKSLLIKAFETGGVILIENVRQINSNRVLKQLIESNIIIENQTQFIILGKDMIPLVPTFKAFICSENISDLTPELFSKITLINWSTDQRNWNFFNDVSDFRHQYISDLKIRNQKEKQLFEEETQFMDFILNEKKKLFNEKHFIDSLITN